MIDPKERVADVPIREFLALLILAKDIRSRPATALRWAEAAIEDMNTTLEVEAREKLAGPAPF